MPGLAEVVVRPALASDAAEIAALQTAAWRDAYAGILPDTALGGALERSQRALWPRVLAPSAAVRAILVATEQDRLLGFVGTKPDPDDPGSDEIATLYVAAPERGRGVGALLMAEAAERLGALGRRRAWLMVFAANPSARAFYARLGGVETAARRAEVMPGAVVDEVRVEFPSLRVLAAAALGDLDRRAAPPAMLASASVRGIAGAPHPVPSADRARGRVKRRLGDAFGLRRFGVNRLELAPGVWSSIPHAHSHEEEFVQVLEGEVWLVSDGAAHRMGPGDCAGFPAGTGRAHHLENRSDRPAVVLEIGSRLPDRDEVVYPGSDLRVVQRPDGSRGFARADGTPVGPAASDPAATDPPATDPPATDTAAIDPPG